MACPTGPLQAMDATALRAVVVELRPLVVPSRFERAQQSDPHTVQIALRRLEGSVWLELSWLAEAPRLLAIDPPPRQGEGSTLARVLQHGLRGLALGAIEQQGWERVVELPFARRPGEPPERTLVLELMGRHSNLFLLDDQRRVIALGRQVRTDQSRLRPIGTGDPYRPPPPPGGESPRPGEDRPSWQGRLQLLPLSLERALIDAYRGLSPALCRQLAAEAALRAADLDPSELLRRPVQSLQQREWDALWTAWRCWLGAVEEGRFTFLQEAEGGWRCWRPSGDPPAPAPGGPSASEGAGELAVNRGLARYYAERLGSRRLEQRRRTLLQRQQAAAERERRNADRQEELLAAVPGAEGLQRRADALLSVGAPSREQIEEAQALYRRARKLRRSVAAITPRLELHRQRLGWLEASHTFLEQADTLQDLSRLEEELEEHAGRNPEGGPPAPRGRGRGRPGDAVPPPRPLELRTPGGLRVLVGRNHRQNEWISFRQARRGDLWFHAQECPGSHVVLKGSEGRAEPADLTAAADLAAHFSRGRGNARVPVVMVPAHQLQRIPGAAPGTVRHGGGEILWGRPDQAAALLEPPNLAVAETP